MIDALLLLAVLVPAAAAGLAVLRAAGALPRAEEDWLVPGLAVGLGLAGMVGLGLAAAGALRPWSLALAGGLALALGGNDAVRALRAPALGRLARAWPLLLVCALVLAAEVMAMAAPPVGGDQTKYQLAYPRLYAAAGRLVATPWSFWGQMQFLQNFVYAIGFALRGDVLARLLGGTTGVLATLALAALARRHLAREAGAVVGTLFFTLPITWSLMTRAGSDLTLVLYGTLALAALLDWIRSTEDGDLRRAAIMAGFAGGSKVMGLLVPALLGIVVLAVLLRRSRPLTRAAASALAFGLLVLIPASPYYLRNAVDTGNPIYPFGYGLFGGRHWSAPASEYLAEYYGQYQTTWAARREGTPYAGIALVRFPWDLTMHADSFERGARQSLDVGPFMLAFAPALFWVRRRRATAFTIAALGAAYAGIIAGATWAHPRYVLPGVAFILVASVPAARALLGRRAFAVAVALTVAGNLALTSRLLQPLWPDQARVVLGRLTPDAFLRRYSPRFAFWERANLAVPSSGRVIVLEKIPHPYYIDRPFVLASYLEQGMIDYHTLNSVEALADVAHGFGVTHVAVDLTTLDARGDPFESRVAHLWQAFLADACEPLMRQDDYALYRLKPATAIAATVKSDNG
jgi:hypothetical protein